MLSFSAWLNFRSALRLAILAFLPFLFSEISQAKDLNAGAFYDRTTGDLFIEIINGQIGAISLETQNPILNFESVITTTPLGVPSIANESLLNWFDPTATGLPTGYFGIGPVFDPGLDFTTVPSANGTRSRVTLGGTDLGLAVLNYTVIGSGIPTQSVNRHGIQQFIGKNDPMDGKGLRFQGLFEPSNFALEIG